MARFLPFRSPPVQRYATSSKGTPAWALVTGSSDGIGKAFAQELAVVYGFNVVIHGRNQVKLEGVRDDILSKCKKAGKKIEVKIIVADTAHAQDINYQTLFVTPLSKLNLTLLINNVGVPSAKVESAFANFMEETSDLDVITVLNTNNLFLTLLTKHLLPLLTTNKPSLIVNISSHVGSYPMPYLSDYSATKAYIKAFTAALDMELSMEAKTKGVSCECLIVGSVNTDYNKMKTSLFTPTAPDFAKQACKVIGSGTRIGAGCWSHALQSYVMSWLPDWLAEFVLRKVAADLRANFLKNA